MSKTEKLAKVYLNIDTATKISHATLTEFMENLEDEQGQYILLGVLKQLEDIIESVNLFDEIMKGGAVAV